MQQTKARISANLFLPREKHHQPAPTGLEVLIINPFTKL